MRIKTTQAERYMRRSSSSMPSMAVPKFLFRGVSSDDRSKGTFYSHLAKSVESSAESLWQG